VARRAGAWQRVLELGRYPGDRRRTDLARAVTLAGMVVLGFM